MPRPRALRRDGGRAAGWGGPAGWDARGPAHERSARSREWAWGALAGQFSVARVRGLEALGSLPRNGSNKYNGARHLGRAGKGGPAHLCVVGCVGLLAGGMAICIKARTAQAQAAG